MKNTNTVLIIIGMALSVAIGVWTGINSGGNSKKSQQTAVNNALYLRLLDEVQSNCVRSGAIELSDTFMPYETSEWDSFVGTKAYNRLPDTLRTRLHSVYMGFSAHNKTMATKKEYRNTDRGKHSQLIEGVRSGYEQYLAKQGITHK